MVVTRLGCQNFRNLRDGELFPCPGVNVIYGGNAQGKTNLLGINLSVRIKLFQNDEIFFQNLHFLLQPVIRDGIRKCHIKMVFPQDGFLLWVLLQRKVCQRKRFQFVWITFVNFYDQIIIFCPIRKGDTICSQRLFTFHHKGKPVLKGVLVSSAFGSCIIKRFVTDSEGIFRIVSKTARRRFADGNGR